jgi:hypothetical protein
MTLVFIVQYKTYEKLRRYGKVHVQSGDSILSPVSRVSARVRTGPVITTSGQRLYMHEVGQRSASIPFHSLDN